MKLTQKGQVTIPRRFREKYGFALKGDVVFEAREEGLLIRPGAVERRRRMREAIANVKGSATAGLSTDDILRHTRQG